MATTEKAGWGTAVAATLFIFCLAADQVMMPLATSSVVQDLSTNMRMVQIAIVLVSLVAAPLYITGSKLGDIHGKRKTFLIGAVLFVLGPVSAVITPNVVGLIVGWSVTKALGMVLAVPASIGLLLTTYPDDVQRRQAFTLYGAGGVIAALAGPLLMGFSAQIASWRLPYGFLILILLLALLLTSQSMQETEKVDAVTIDWGGTVLSFAAIAAILLGAILLAVPFLLSLLLAFLLIMVGVVITAVLLKRLRKVAESGRHPLFQVGLFHNRIFLVAWGATLLAFALSGAIPFTIPVFTEQALLFGSMQSALVMFAFAVGSVILGFVSDQLLPWLAPRRLIQLFLIVMVMGLLWLAAVTSSQMTLMTFLLPMLLVGAGFGVVGAQLPNIQLSDLLPEQQEEASGLAELGKEVGIGLGTAVIGSIMFNIAISRFVENFTGWTGNLAQVSQEAFVAGFQGAVVILAAIVFCALLLSFFLPDVSVEAVAAEEVRELLADVSSKRV